MPPDRSRDDRSFRISITHLQNAYTLLRTSAAISYERSRAACRNTWQVIISSTAFVCAMNPCSHCRTVAGEPMAEQDMICSSVALSCGASRISKSYHGGCSRVGLPQRKITKGCCIELDR